MLYGKHDNMDKVDAAKPKTVNTTIEVSNENKISASEKFAKAKVAAKNGITVEVQQMYEDAYITQLKEARASGNQDFIKTAEEKLINFYKNNPIYAKLKGII